MENIFKKYDDNIISSQYESYRPQITTELNKPNRKTSIIVDGTDKFVNYKHGKVYIRYDCLQEDDTKYPSKSNIRMSDNGGAFMIKKIETKLGNKPFDECDNVGILSLMKGCISYAIDGNGPTQNSGFEATNEGGGTGEFIIPFSDLGLGSAKDVKQLFFNARFEIIFTRNFDNDALFLTPNTEATAETKLVKAKQGKINILELMVLIPTIKFDEISKVQLVNELVHNPCILAFKKWQNIEIRNITGKKIKIDVTNNLNSNKHPKFGIIGFQTDRLDNQEKNASNFDHCKVVNYSFTVNGITYPNEMQNLDFDDLKYCQAYEDHMSYKKTYYKSHEENPLMYLNKNQFRKFKPLFVVNMSRHPNQIAVGNTKVILNVDLAENLPDKTICYICLIYSSVYKYDVERGIIDEIY